MKRLLAWGVAGSFTLFWAVIIVLAAKKIIQDTQRISAQDWVAAFGVISVTAVSLYLGVRAFLWALETLARRRK